MYLGLDLRGGVHFLMEVDTAQVIGNKNAGFADELRTLFRKNNVSAHTPKLDSQNNISIAFKSQKDKSEGLKLIQENLVELVLVESDSANAGCQICIERGRNPVHGGIRAGSEYHCPAQSH